MKRILLAIDSQNMNINAVDFACYLARLSNSELTAIFLEDLLIENPVMVSQQDSAPLASMVREELEQYENKIRKRDENMRLFIEMAEEREVEAFVYLDRGVPAADMISASLFADMLVVDAATSFTQVQEGPPTVFVKSILQEAGCPVIIAPESFQDIENIVFCYDGSKSSVYAIKQFTYLFPELRHKKARLVYLNKENEPSMEEDLAVVQLVKHYYKDTDFMALDVNNTSLFFEYLLEKKNDFVVMGGYGKGLLTSFFEFDAEADEYRTTSLPIFVAHY